MKYKLNKNMYYRFENNIDNGTFIIFDIENELVHGMTVNFKILVESINNNLSESEMITIFKYKYSELSKVEIEQSLKIMIKKLVQLNFLLGE